MKYLFLSLCLLILVGCENLAETDPKHGYSFDGIVWSKIVSQSGLYIVEVQFSTGSYDKYLSYEVPKQEFDLLNVGDEVGLVKRNAKATNVSSR